MKLDAQVDLTGKKLEFEKDRVETWKDIFTGQYFRINVSEEDHDKIDRMHEKGQDHKIRKYISTKMKPYLNLPTGRDGEAYQADFELFAKIL